jgi:hypothetical protein
MRAPTSEGTAEIVVIDHIERLSGKQEILDIASRPTHTPINNLWEAWCRGLST